MSNFLFYFENIVCRLLQSQKTLQHCAGTGNRQHSTNRHMPVNHPIIICIDRPQNNWFQ